MEKWELEKIIHDLQIKLDFLQEKVDDNNYQVYGTDVKYNYGQRTRGTQAEIEATKAQIALYQKELDKRSEYEYVQQSRKQEKFDSFAIEDQKRNEEKESKIAREKERLDVFKMVKARYTKSKGRGFQKLTARLFGNGPKWRQVREYTQEELEFILRALSGETAMIKNSNQHIKGKTELEKSRKIKDRNWNNFVKLLNSKYHLKNQMIYEENSKGL